MKTWIKRLLVFTILAALAGAGVLAWYGNRPLNIQPLPTTLNVTPGTHMKSLSAMLKPTRDLIKKSMKKK